MREQEQRHYLDAAAFALAEAREDTPGKNAILAHYRSLDDLVLLMDALATILAHLIKGAYQGDPEAAMQLLVSQFIGEVGGRDRLRPVLATEGK